MILPSHMLLLDVGGTFIKCSDGRCIPMPSAGTRDQIAAALRSAVRSLTSPAGLVRSGTEPRAAENFTPSGECCPQLSASPQSPAAPPILAVAIPGPFDYEHGIFLMRHKFAAVYGESFRTLAGLPASVDLRFMHDVVATLEGSLSDPAGLVRSGTKPRAAENFTPSGECCPQLGASPQSPAATDGCETASDAAGDCRRADRCGEHSPKGAKLSAPRNGLPSGTKTAAPAAQETALVTIGTGLGFAHTEGGRVQVAPSGSPARSIYNLPWDDGILEDTVSARGIRNAYARLSGRSNLSAAQIAQCADAGDESALQVFSDLGKTLGQALAPMLEELHVGTLLLAGQVSKSLPLFDRPLRNALDGIDIRPAPEGAVFAGLRRLAGSAKPRFDTLER